ncbi:MAG: hypothetical protein CBC29_01900 [Methylococcaceae bacterium TMED69]|nr:MAG: hypothetical protein CBC29_01900 [Methylococcaceae bacterium TMED69]
MLIIGHRGASYDMGENTVGGITTAIRAGVDGVEIDIRRSDNRVILLHDITVTRTTNGHGLHKNYSFHSLRNLVCKNGERIPTIEEVMPLLLKTTYIYLEVKEPNMLELVWQVLKKVPEKNQKNIYISSFDENIIKSFKANKKIKKAFITAAKKPQLAARCEELNCSQIHVSLEVIDEMIVDEAHRNNLKVLVFTVNKSFDLKRCLDLKVDGIFTDLPIEMIEALRRTGAKSQLKGY